MCREDREIAWTNILVFIYPDSTITFVHLSVHVIQMGGYKLNLRHSNILIA
jgi:hypothetical protein